MGWFWKSKEEKILEQVLEKMNIIDIKLDNIQQGVEDSKVVDVIPVIKSVQTSFNGIKASNDNLSNRIINMVRLEFIKYLGEDITKKDIHETIETIEEEINNISKEKE